jgi:hypothetical protein
MPPISSRIAELVLMPQPYVAIERAPCARRLFLRTSRVLVHYLVLPMVWPHDSQRRGTAVSVAGRWPSPPGAAAFWPHTILALQIEADVPLHVKVAVR